MRWSGERRRSRLCQDVSSHPCEKRSSSMRRIRILWTQVFSSSVLFLFGFLGIALWWILNILGCPWWKIVTPVSDLWMCTSVYFRVSVRTLSFLFLTTTYAPTSRMRQTLWRGFDALGPPGSFSSFSVVLMPKHVIDPNWATPRITRKNWPIDLFRKIAPAARKIHRPRPSVDATV